MMMRKVLKILFVLCITLSLVACSGGDKTVNQRAEVENIGDLYKVEDAVIDEKAEEIIPEVKTDDESADKGEENSTVEATEPSQKEVKPEENTISESESEEVAEETGRIIFYEAPQQEEIVSEEVVTEEVQPVDEPVEEKISLKIDCSDILNDINALKKEKHGLVPNNGIIYASDTIEAISGDSVFDILKKELLSRGIHLEFNLAPITNSAYIEGIGNIYEFDCGERSGWKYSVNGEFPRVGCSEYKVSPGDDIVFVYKIKAY